MSRANADPAVADLTPNKAGDLLMSMVLDELVCEICLGIVNEPKKLDCAHSFCRTCLHRLLMTCRRGLLSPVHSIGSDQANGATAPSESKDSAERENDIACPTCDKVTTVPGGDVDQLGTSAALSRLLKMNNTGWTDAVQDEMRQSIRRRRSSSSTSLSAAQLSLCSVHGSVQEFYCVQCKTLVCGHCMLSKHKMHIDHVKSAQEAEDRMTAGLRSLMQPSQEAVFTADGVTGLIGQLKKDVVQRSTTSSNHIKQFFNQARELLKDREAELIARVEMESMKVISDLTQKEEVVRRNLAQLSRYMDQVRATLQQPGDAALLTSTHGLIATMENSHKQIQDISLALSQEKSLSLSFEGTEINFNDLGCLTGDTKNTDDGGYVTIKAVAPFPPDRSPLFQGPLTSSHSPTSLATIREKDHSPYSEEPLYEEPVAMASYSRRTPKLPPRVSLTRRTSSSLLKVTATVKHIVTCDAQTINMKPFGIAVGETDAIIVSDIHSHCVKVLARSGKVMDTIVGPQSPQQIYSPVCLTTDRESQLYILDKEGKKSIYRFKNGNFDTTFTNKVNKSYKLSQSWGMAVTDDLIYVTDWQKSCIHIFQTSGKYKDTLSCGQQSEKAVMKHPVGIAVMPDGSLVVADHDSHCVWKVVHTKDIVEFQQIGSENILHSPYGVAVTREGYIVVTDTGTSQVCLFSPTGTFITFLGKKGSEKGEFNLPRHVCTTPGGEILVADEGNQRIQVFELCHGS